jgi:tetratricopeptide (TPR) repeat protein
MMLAVLSGCASPPPPQSAADRRLEQANQAHERASAALTRGEYNTALRHYQATLDRSAAVEDQNESAISMLNIAAAQHRSGNYAAVRSTLLALIAHEPPFAASYIGRAEARLALVELQQNRVDEATLHAARAEQLCPAGACPWSLALQNIMTEIDLRRGDLGAADIRVRVTLAAAGRGTERREEANAWRLLGEIEARRGRLDEARRALLTALDIDGKLEVPERIALDLISLARLEAASGDREAGRRYARRAAAVAEAAKLAAVLAQAHALLDTAK